MTVVTSAAHSHRPHVQGASWETDVFKMDVMQQVEEVEAWVGGN